MAHAETKHPSNISEPLEGTDQTNNRAELTAVIRAVQVDARPLDIRSDSRYVVDGVDKHLSTWRRSSFRKANRDIANRDLWESLDNMLLSRNCCTVLITHVLGHASAEDFREGKSTVVDTTPTL